jgi:uncharacterized protein (TIGR00290 family)
MTKQSAQSVLLAWSGGKDSTMALAALQADPAFQVIGLVTAVTAGYERISIHGVRRSILQAQAAVFGLPVFEAMLTPQASNEDYKTAWAGALRRARVALGAVDTVAFGDLFLDDVRRYREALGSRIGYRSIFPLWGRDTSEVAAEFIASGYEAYLTCVDTTQLSADFAGRRFDASSLASCQRASIRVAKTESFTRV